MKSIHTDDRGKYPVAVYECRIQGYVTEEWVKKLWPRSYGRNVTAYGYTNAVGETRWHMLIANTEQTTVSDITSRIDLRMPKDRPFTYQVSVVASVAQVGYGPHAGSPRSGTKRVRLNSPHSKIVAAR